MLTDRSRRAVKRGVGIAMIALAVASSSASAQTGDAIILGTFGEWSALRGGGDVERICFAASEPVERRPENLRRGPGYIFVTYRPSEDVVNEIAFILGFPTAEGAAASGSVDGRDFEFVTTGENAWLVDPLDEGRLVDAFVRGRRIELNVTSARGNANTDVYSLSGFTAAMRRARQECQ